LPLRNCVWGAGVRSKKIAQTMLCAVWIASLAGPVPCPLAAAVSISHKQGLQSGIAREDHKQERKASATGEVSGRIEVKVCTSDGRSVSGAKVTIKVKEGEGSAASSGREAEEASEGTFVLAGLPAGEYILRAEAPGFRPATRGVVLTADAPNASVTVNLLILPVTETIVVSETRSEEQMGGLPAKITMLGREELERSTALTVDDFLKQVPSFSLFRRTSSLVSQPTTQGVSLRGLGASGVSRTLVLLDGVPFNDPVGSWVYWSMIPKLQIAHVEIDEGGVSSLYGSSAMAGVIDIITRRPVAPVFDMEGLWGTRGTGDLEFFTGERRGRLTYSAGGSAFRTDGYVLVPEPFRGPVDINATSQHETLNGRVDDELSPKTMIFLAGRYFNERRGNGTPLQGNATREGMLQAGLRSHNDDGNNWQANFFSFEQRFRSSFSSVAADRQSETLSLFQNEPSYGYGGNVQWSKLLPGSQLLAVGGDGRWTYARDQESVFSSTGANTIDRRIPGEQALAGFFLQDYWTPLRRLSLMFGARTDYWKNYNASRSQTTLSTNTTTLTLFPETSKTTVTGRAGVVLGLSNSVSLRAAFYQGFRAPTLDELYRSFRVGNVVTNANPDLGPERVNGYEFGVNQQITPRFFWNATVFADRLDSAISNVTISTTPSLITQQRQNLGYANVKGAEAGVNDRLGLRWVLQANYMFSQAVVGSFAANPAIVGNLLPQVPKHRASLLISYSRPKWVDASIEGRYESHRFDDSLNQLKLGSYFVLNMELSRAMGERWKVFVSLENAFNRQYTVQNTPVPQTGTPILFSGGVRFHWANNR
jgi:outer membrane receptor protein involved in Fe transport